MRLLLDEWAEANGYRAGWFAAAIVDHALRRIQDLRGEVGFDEAYYRRSLSWLEGPGIGLEPGERSVILAAVPRPAHILTFDHQGGSLDAILPPTCHNTRGVAAGVKEDLERVLGDRTGIRPLRAPVKAMAAIAGFARYGRNNLAYVGGLGSYAQLMAFATSLPPDEIPGPVDPAALDECRGCRACEGACPNQAITGDRFLINAERCLAWLAEVDGDLPAAFAAAKRPCLVGCMACQEICPLNKGLLRFERLGVSFSPGETEFLIRQGSPGSATVAIRAKAKSLGLSLVHPESGRPSPLYSRNLGALLEHSLSLSTG